MSLPIVAVVGRPNVGKSTLFNKLIGQRLSIVEDTPGVTRDRIYSKCEWRSKEFMVVDTGGIEPESNDVILAQMRRQSQLAIEKADVIVFVTDIRCGVTADDYAVAEMLQKSGKPVILAVNKVDSLGEPPMELYEFYNLGLGDPYPISSVHGHGTGDMLDAVYDLLPDMNEPEYDEEVIKVAVIGKPNAGKSSLINKIAGEELPVIQRIPSSKMTWASSCLSTQPVSARSPRSPRRWSITVCCVRIWQLTVQTFALSCLTLPRASLSRTRRLPVMPMSREKPALWQ